MLGVIVLLAWILSACNGLKIQVQFTCVCPPGHFVSAPCDPNLKKSATCVRCKPGTFNDNTNEARFCANCSRSCTYRRHQIHKKCTATHDLICLCESGYYFSKEHDRCLRHSKCPVGYGVIKRGTTEDDTVCEICKLGSTFSQVESALDGCLPCTDCTMYDLGMVERVCNKTHDAVCRKRHGKTSSSLQSSTSSVFVTTDKNNGEFPTGGIVGISVGVILLIVIILIVAVVCFKKPRRHPPRHEPPDTDSDVPWISMRSEDFRDVVEFIVHNLSSFEPFYLYLPGNSEWCDGQNKVNHDHSRQANPHDIQNYMRQAMNLWRNGNGVDVTFEAIYKALEESQNMAVAKKFEKKFEKKLCISDQNGTGQQTTTV